MNNQYTEEEEKFLSWFKDNLKSLLAGLFLGIFFIISYKYYVNYQDQITTNLSFEYEKTIQKYREGDTKYLLEKDKQLSNDYPANIYTNLISLYSVKVFIDNNEIDKAFEKLNFVISNSPSQHIKMIAQIRKARLMISNDQLVDAKNLIQRIDPNQKNYILVELLGDIYFKNGEIELAKKKYNEVLNFNLTPNKLKIMENKINTIQ